MAAPPRPADPPRERNETQQTGFTIDADADRYAGPAPLTVRFSVQPKRARGPVHIRWSFDDGTTSTEERPVHRFRRHRWYVVRVEVTDGASPPEFETLLLHAWRADEWQAMQARPDPRIVHKTLRELARRTGATIP